MKIRLRSCLGWLLASFLSLFLLAAFAAGGAWWYFHPGTGETATVIYGERNEKPLSYEVIPPAQDANGAAVLVMVSGSWKSDPESFQRWLAAPFLRGGYTVFAISHLSQPKALIGEIVEDVHRAVRHIRHHAGDYGVDPERFGVTGGSSGGHLSLMLATRGEAGPADASDPVERESSAVQAAAIFFPVTDLLNLGASTENPGDGGPPISYVEGFGPGVDDLAVWKPLGRELSPIFHIGENLPPVLIHHGDADTLVPLDQSTRFREAAAAEGKEVELVVHPGKGHGWLGMIFEIRRFRDWFDEHL